MAPNKIPTTTKITPVGPFGTYFTYTLPAEDRSTKYNAHISALRFALTQAFPATPLHASLTREIVYFETRLSITTADDGTSDKELSFKESSEAERQAARAAVGLPPDDPEMPERHGKGRPGRNESRDKVFRPRGVVNRKRKAEDEGKTSVAGPSRKRKAEDGEGLPEAKKRTTTSFVPGVTMTPPEAVRGEISPPTNTNLDPRLSLSSSTTISPPNGPLPTPPTREKTPEKKVWWEHTCRCTNCPCIYHPKSTFCFTSADRGELHLFRHLRSIQLERNNPYLRTIQVDESELLRKDFGPPAGEPGSLWVNPYDLHRGNEAAPSTTGARNLFGDAIPEAVDSDSSATDGFSDWEIVDLPAGEAGEEEDLYSAPVAPTGEVIDLTGAAETTNQSHALSPRRDWDITAASFSGTFFNPASWDLETCLLTGEDESSPAAAGPGEMVDLIGEGEMVDLTGAD